MKTATLSAHPAALAALTFAAFSVGCSDDGASGTSGNGGSSSSGSGERAELSPAEYCFLNPDLRESMGIADCAALGSADSARLADHFAATGEAEGRWWNLKAQCSERADSETEIPCDFWNLVYWKSCRVAEAPCDAAMNDGDALRQHYLDTGRVLGLKYSGVPDDFSGEGYCGRNDDYAAIYGPGCDDETAGWHYILFGKAEGRQYSDPEPEFDPFADYTPIADEPAFKIVGYAQGGTSGTTWNDAYMSKMTHVVVFGNEVTANGDIVWKNNDTTMLGYWGYWGSKVDTRVMVAFGGWNKSNGFTAMAADSAARARFVDQLAELKRHHVYGVDIDWENDGNHWPYPGAGVNTLLSEMAARLHPLGMKISIALAATTAGGFDDTGAAAVDWINVMCYDGENHGTFAKISSCKENYAGWKAKSVIGVPFYVRNPERTYAGGGRSEVVSLDGMAAAVDTIRNWNDLGVMFWDMSHDKTDSASSLLHAIARTAGYAP